MPEIRALLLDMDQTLTRDRESARLSVERVAPLIQQRFAELRTERLYEVFRKVNNSHWENFDDSPIAKYVSSIEARAHIWHEALRELGHDDLDYARTVASHFERAREETYFSYEDSLVVLKELHGTLPIVLVTNGHTLMQRKKIDVSGIAPYLDAVFIAQEVGTSKPHATIFEMALEAAGVEAQEALMVGDNPEKDIWGAKQLGIQTAWMRRPESGPPRFDPDADFVVQDMHEVQGLLERVNV